MHSALKTRLLFLTLLPLSFQQLYAQCCENLIPNGSFENFSALPDDDCDWQLATGWQNAATTDECGPANGTPDYFHLNGTGPFSALPENYFATVSPLDGNAIMGVSMYSSLPDFREYLSIPLTCPLEVGQTYTFSFYITLGLPNIDAYACNNIGARFSQGPIFQPDGTTEPIALTPQLVVSDVLENTDWQQITFEFVADAPYDYFTFGNFATDAATSTVVLGQEDSFTFAYYFVDQFELLPLGGGQPEVSLGPDLDLCTGETLTLSAGNPGSDYVWSTNETTESITVSAPGTYGVTVINSCGTAQDQITVGFQDTETSMVNATICAGESYDLGGTSYTASGTYVQLIPNGAANGCDLEVMLELNVLPLEQEEVVASICAGETYVLNGVAYTEAGFYTQLIPGGGANGCDLEVSLTLSVLPSAVAELEVEICRGELYEFNGTTYTDSGLYTQVLAGAGANGCDSVISLILTVAAGEIALQDLQLRPGERIVLGPELSGITTVESIQWVPGLSLSCTDCLNPVLTATENQRFSLLVTDASGCTYEASFQLTVLQPVQLYLPNAFSPNGDGVNDTFFPQGREDPQLVRLGPLRIFNRWGGLVFERERLTLNAPADGWAGRGAGDPEQSSVFVYFLEYELQDGTIEVISGDVLLLR